MDVRVVCEPSPAERTEADYVAVRTCSDPNDDTVTLATIERVVEKKVEAAERRLALVKRIKILIMRQPMSRDEALVLATSYAERKKIPVVYTGGA